MTGTFWQVISGQRANGPSLMTDRVPEHGPRSCHAGYSVWVLSLADDDGGETGENCQISAPVRLLESSGLDKSGNSLPHLRPPASCSGGVSGGDRKPEPHQTPELLPPGPPSNRQLACAETRQSFFEHAACSVFLTGLFFLFPFAICLRKTSHSKYTSGRPPRL